MTVILCLIALLTPFLTALAISEGLKLETHEILESGPSVLVTQDQFGSNAPVSLSCLPILSALPGVREVVPRVIGRTYIRNYFLAVLGIDSLPFPPAIQVVQGRNPQEPGDVLLGENAAKICGLSLGQSFFLSRNPLQVFKVTGLFRSSFSIWNSDLIIMSFRDGAKLFGLTGKATDLLISTEPGQERAVAEKIAESRIPQSDPGLPLRVQSKTLIQQYVLRGFDTKAGIFSGIYSLAFFLAIPILLVTTGLGLSGRKKEIGIMKALGWQTQEVLTLLGMESLGLALASLPFIYACSQIWIQVFNGIWVTRFFVANLEILPPFSLPATLFPLPMLLTILLALILTLTGSLYSIWRTAIISPFEAIQDKHYF